MAEKEEVGSLIVGIGADTSDFDAEMAKLPAKAATAGTAITDAFGAGSTDAFEQALRELAGDFTTVAAAAETTGAAIKRIFANAPIEDTGTGLGTVAAGMTAAGDAAETLVTDMSSLLSKTQAVDTSLQSLGLGAGTIWAGYIAGANRAAIATQEVAAAARAAAAAPPPVPPIPPRPPKTDIERLFNNQPIEETAASLNRVAAGMEEVSNEASTLVVHMDDLRAAKPLADLDRAAAEAAASFKTVGTVADDTAARVKRIFSGAAIEDTSAPLTAVAAGMSAAGAAADSLVVDYGKMKAGATAAGAAAASAGTAAAAGISKVVPAATAAVASIDKMAVASRAAVKNTSFMASNLVAQFQDVGVQIAAGTSPLQIALQQGTQMALVFNAATAAGATLGQKMALVGEALISLTSAATIVPIILIAAGAAAIQFFTQTGEKAKSTEDILKDFTETVKGIGTQWGINTDRLTEFMDKTKELSLAELSKQLVELQQARDKGRDELNTAAGSFMGGFAPPTAIRGFTAIEDVFHDLSNATRLGQDDLENYKKRLQEVRDEAGDRLPDAGKLLINNLIIQIETFQNVTEAIEANRKAQEDLKNSTAIAVAARKIKDYAAAMKELAGIDPVPESTIEKFKRLTEELKNSSTSISDMVRAYGALKEAQDRIHDQGVVSFNTEEFGGALSKAEALLKHFEGFIDKPKMDVTGLAIGFGLHQRWVDQLHKTIPIVASDVMDWDEAVRQLSIQVANDYMPRVERALGPETWSKIDDNVKAALTSIAFNFGHLEPELVKAAQSLDPNIVADAIRKMKKPDVPENKAFNTRREEEALAAVGLSTLKLTEAQNDYVVSTEHANQVTELWNRLTFEGSYEQERQTFILKQQLKWKEDHITVTKEMNALLEQSAINHANAAVQSEREAEARRAQTAAEKEANAQRKLDAEQARVLQRAFDAVAGTIENAFVDAIFNGKKLNDVFKDLIRSLAIMLLKAQLAKLFGALFNTADGTSGGFLGPLFSSFFGKTKLGATASPSSSPAAPAAAPTSVPTAPQPVTLVQPAGAESLQQRAQRGPVAHDVNVNVTPSPLLTVTWEKRAVEAETNAISRGPAVARNNSRRFGVG